MRCVAAALAAMLLAPAAFSQPVVIEPLVGQPAVSGTLSACERAGQAAELRLGLPPGLLLAIGRVESGRWEPALGRVAPWPWTIDVAGAGRLFNAKAEAVDATTSLRAAGAANIDVGCFQISLLHHPDAFSTLEQAFDPDANADYAGRFLLDLRTRTGSWAQAVAAYHSADPMRGEPYRAAVYATWANPSDPAMAPLPAEVFGVHVWTPTIPGRPASSVPLSARLPNGQRLPHIVTP